MEEIEPAAIVVAVHLQRVDHARMHDSRQEVVDDKVLVVKTHLALDVGKRERWMLLHHAVVEAQEQALELRHDRVFVIAWIADHRPWRTCVVARQIARVGIAAAVNGIAQDEPVVRVIHVRLVVRSATVDVVQIETGRAEVRERVRIVLLLEAAGGIERQVVVDELAEVRVERRHAALFIVLAVFRRIERGGHRLAERQQVLLVLCISRAERGGGQRPEHSPKSALEQRRATGGQQSAWRLTVSFAHGTSLIMPTARFRYLTRGPAPIVPVTGSSV